ncbi:hypothetical protein PR002_g841 [Phytophthora rubi]|uniref:Uncharacterized protein n=1 Tax=Phytophthora rubi TaxID=129364 RepID=A0A6A3NQT8_9STRA|nr:hypothetical protein PR002_g841 [Phytophthora rubi]
MNSDALTIDISELDGVLIGGTCIGNTDELAMNFRVITDSMSVVSGVMAPA